MFLTKHVEITDLVLIVKEIDCISTAKNCLLTSQTRLTIDNINVTNKTIMTEQQRTDLLNYLNDNKIAYEFINAKQEVIINLTVKE